jgi:hypothetical protein
VRWTGAAARWTRAGGSARWTGTVAGRRGGPGRRRDGPGRVRWIRSAEERDELWVITPSSNCYNNIKNNLSFSTNQDA